MATASSRIVEVEGEGRELGRQLGEAAREGVHAAVATLMAEIPAGRRDQAREQALSFLPSIQEGAPHLVPELEGLAEGAAIPLADALLLQVRFELVGYEAPAQEGCTSFAYAQGDVVLAGQNVDTTPDPEPLGIVVKMRPKGRPAVMMYTYYPGMLGYLGINDRGLACFGNAVVCSGWKVGFPRYLTLRRILEASTVDEATENVKALSRGSSINAMLADRTGRTRDLELTVDDVGVIEGREPVLVHANHYVLDGFREDDQLVGIAPDSVDRMDSLGRRLREPGGPLGLDDVKAALCDHENFPHSICRHRVEPPRNTADKQKTIASLIGEPREGRFHVCFGNPCQGEFVTTSF